MAQTWSSYKTLILYQTCCVTIVLQIVELPLVCIPGVANYYSQLIINKMYFTYANQEVSQHLARVLRLIVTVVHMSLPSQGPDWACHTSDGVAYDLDQFPLMAWQPASH